MVETNQYTSLGPPIDMLTGREKPDPLVESKKKEPKPLPGATTSSGLTKVAEDYHHDIGKIVKKTPIVIPRGSFPNVLISIRRRRRR